MLKPALFSFFVFNDTATTEIYTLSLHDALPISPFIIRRPDRGWVTPIAYACAARARSEEHTSELQSRVELVCRLLLETKKKSRERDGGDNTEVSGVESDRVYQGE